MSLGSRVRSWLGAVTKRSRMEGEMDAELRFHLEAFAEDLVRGGVPREEALRRAHIDFGGIEGAKEECRDARGVTFLETLFQDLRYGFRALRKHPNFAAVVILTLALGIGASTLIFSVAYGVLFRPLPYPSAEKILTLWESNPEQNLPKGQVSAANFYDWQRGSRVFSSMAAYAVWRFNLTGVPEPESISGALVTPDFFSVLEFNAIQGRTFQSDEDQPGKDAVVVVSQSLWNRVFGPRTKLCGQTLTLNQSVFTVIGVVSHDFGYPSRTTELWVPLGLTAENRQNRDGRWLTVISRMKRGASAQQVAADLNVISAQLQAAYPKADRNVSIRALSLHEYLVGETRITFVALLGAVGLLLSLACANIASLLVANGSERASEFAIRYAIGATRGRITRQLLTESTLLVAVGATLGMLLAYWAVQAIPLMNFTGIPRIHEIRIDVPAAAFTLAVSLVVAVMVGFIPASRARSNDSLKEGTKRLTSGSAVQDRRRILVIVQIALAFILLAGAGLLTNSFIRLIRVSPGFQVNDRLSFRIALPRSKYKTNLQQIAFFNQMLDKINQQNSVLASGGVSDLPLLGNSMAFKVMIERSAFSGSQIPPQASVRWTTPGYFAAIGMSLWQGRLFSARDGVDTLPVAIINKSMANRYWPAGEAIGARIRLEEDYRWFTIVGIVSDIRQEALDSEEGPALYFTYAQKSELWLNWVSVVVHSATDPRGMVSQIREQIRSLDKDQPVTEIATLRDHLANLEALPRLRMTVIGIFAFMALSVSIVGIFGMISYSVAQRSHEIGIRVALGAQASDILRQFLSQGIRCILFGLSLGFVGAWLVTRVLKGLLFGVNPLDGLTFTLVTTALFFVALAACWLPARRATRVDPMVALRYE